MKTKKITLNELKVLVKEIIKEENAWTGDFSSYDASDTARSYEDDAKRDAEYESKIDKAANKIKQIGILNYIKQSDLPLNDIAALERASYDSAKEIYQNEKVYYNALIDRAEKDINRKQFAMVFEIFLNAIKDNVGDPKFFTYKKGFINLYDYRLFK
jgi:hypothetical protein